VSGANGYQVELSKSDDWSDASSRVPLPANGDVATDSMPVPQTLVHGVYFWRVRGTNASGAGNWSGDAQVYKAWDDAPSTAASSPSSDATATQSGIASYPWRFAWTPIPDASSYEIEFSTDPTLPTPGTVQGGKTVTSDTTVECLTTQTSFTPYNSGDGIDDVGVDGCDLSTFDPHGTTVYWRVRGIDDSSTADVTQTSESSDLLCFGVPGDENGGSNDLTNATTLTALGSPTSKGQECSLWSPTKTVADFDSGVGSGTPGTVSGVTLNCPGTAPAYNCTTTPEISWQPTANTPLYAVTIANDPSFTDDLRVYSTPFLSLTPRDQLPDYTAGSGYYVAVSACTIQSGPVITCGTPTIVSFTKRTPALTGLSQTAVSGGELLSWKGLLGSYGATSTGSPALEALDYEVEVTNATDTGFDNPVFETTVDAACNSAALTCYQPSATTAPGADQVVVSPATTGSYIWRVLPVDLSGNVLPQAVDSSAFTIDVSKPQFHFTTKSGFAVSSPLTIVSSEPVITPVNTTTLKVVPSGSPLSDAVAGTIHQGANNTTWVFTPSKPLAIGGSYVLSVDNSVIDDNGNSAVVSGGAIRAITTAKDTSKGWTYSSGWVKHSASGARSGSYKSASAGHTAKLTVVGSEAVLYGCKSPKMGSISVTVAGKTQVVSEHQSFTRCGVQLWSKALPSGSQTITVKVTHTKGDIDEVKVS
jgi:hypothetical protein